MSTPDPAVLDEAVLEQLLDSVDGDRAFVDDLVGAYLADAEAHVDAIRHAAEQGDAEALVRPAHTLKSSSATVGALRLSGTARELEMAGRSGELDTTVAETTARMGDEWTATADALRTWMTGGS